MLHNTIQCMAYIAQISVQIYRNKLYWSLPQRQFKSSDGWFEIVLPTPTPTSLCPDLKLSRPTSISSTQVFNLYLAFWKYYGSEKFNSFCFYSCLFLFLFTLMQLLQLTLVCELSGTARARWSLSTIFMCSFPVWAISFTSESRFASHTPQSQTCWAVAFACMPHQPAQAFSQRAFFLKTQMGLIFWLSLGSVQ